MTVSNGYHQLKVSTPIENVWSFMSDMDKWAPLVPGYMEHKLLSNRQSIWKLKGDISVIQKTISVKIDITEWKKPAKISFDITGLNENFTGNGYFKVERILGRETQIAGYLNISVKGMMRPLINPVLKTFIPKTIEQLLNKAATKMKEREVILT